ncbi:MAG: hypothetical protein KTQ49_00700 [Candidatus Omnitrophica bacterium]|nr:hypothetical protein [Candidatus Omnitrophota bacterium]
MLYLYGAAVLALVVSLRANHQKTRRALTVAWRECAQIFPELMIMVVLVTIFLFLVPDRAIASFLGGREKWSGFLFAVLLGSITIMPGFIAFPLCGILLKQGVSYMVLSAFANTLMMVGVVTFPIEKRYFGVKITVIRNGLSLVIAVIVALATGFFYGELFR